MSTNRKPKRKTIKTYNYVYKIIQLSTGREYIGIHSTDDFNDGYMGSGTLISFAVDENPSDFVKTIIWMGKDRAEIEELEATLVTEEYLLKNFPEKTFNQVPGGDVPLNVVLKWSKILSVSATKKYYPKRKSIKSTPGYKNPLVSDIPAKERNRFATWKSKAKGSYDGFDKWSNLQIRRGMKAEWIETFRNSLN